MLPITTRRASRSKRLWEVASHLATPHVDGTAEEPREAATGFVPSPAPVETTFTVGFAKSHREIECGSEQHVLDAARKAGVRLPASCTQGMCGTCKVRLLSGEVDMKHAGGIRQREIDQGMVLLCCSKPLSDLVVDK